MRLVVVAPHPVSYQASYLRALAAAPGIDLLVLSAPGSSSTSSAVDPGAAGADPVERSVALSFVPIEGLESTVTDPGEADATSASEIRELLRGTKAEVLLLLGWRSRLAAQLVRAARRLGMPVLLRAEVTDLSSHSIWTRLGDRRFLRRMAGVLSVGKASRRYCVASGVPSARLFDALFAIDNSLFAAEADRLRPQRNELRRAWQVPGDGFCILFAGKLQAKKRPLDLLDALEQARRTRSDLRLLIAGSGELEPDLRERAKERRLPVTFAGFLNQTEMPRAYAAADALVLPSDAGETWGLVVNEAMASGVPAVVSDRVGCREDLVEDGVTGFSFPLGDTRSLAACLTSLAADPIRAAAMGEAARQLVLSRYSIDRAVAGTVAALEKLLGR